MRSIGPFGVGPADPPWLAFQRGGFELAGLRPVLVRAMNVLRQYPLEDVAPAWSAMCSRADTVVEGNRRAPRPTLAAVVKSDP